MKYIWLIAYKMCLRPISNKDVSYIQQSEYKIDLNSFCRNDT